MSEPARLQVAETHCRTRNSSVFLIALISMLWLVSPAATAEEMGAMIAHGMPNASFTLLSGIAQGKKVFIGKDGAIDGQVNPTLAVHEGDVVLVTLINVEGVEHDIVIPDLHASSQRSDGPGASSTLVFHAKDIGSFAYFGTIPGHREAGMEGLFKVEPAALKAAPSGVSISRDPSDLPSPVGARESTTIRFDLEAVERVGRLAANTTYKYWTFNGKVPGPLLRVRVGDTVIVSLTNAANNAMPHNIDLHAVRGPGGGGDATGVAPSETKAFTFKALTPGLYLYHCEMPIASNHISNGMYGLILVEPVGGLPKVDREFYVMQGELYTTATYGQSGAQEFSYDKLMDEHPDYFVFNGAVGALTEEHPLRAKTGETIRVYFGVGGPNFASSFHIVGTIFDRVYAQGSFGSPPLTGVPTVMVTPGGAAVVDLSLPVPGRFLLVDHALTRMERGLVGALIVDGQAAPEIYHVGDDSNQVAPPVKAAKP
jgi:nitrite reductase (NO-forming)